MGRLARAAGASLIAAALLSFSTGAAHAQTPACDPPATQPLVITKFKVTGDFDPAEGRRLKNAFFNTLLPLGPGLAWLDLEEFARQLQQEAITLLYGNTGTDILENGLRGDFIATLTLDSPHSSPSRVARIVVTSVRTEAASSALSATLPIDPVRAEERIVTLARQLGTTLQCDLLGRRLLPVRPVLAVDTAAFAQLGTTATVEATLVDAEDGLPQPGEDVRIEHRTPSGILTWQTATTNFNGVAAADFAIGNVPGPAIVQAFFRRDDGLRAESPVGAYRVMGPAGDLTLSAPEAALEVGESETMTAHLQRDGAPVAGQPVAFSATDGGLAEPVVITDAAGEARTAYQTPATNTLVDVAASAAAPQPGAPPLTASLTFVVDAGVSFAVNTEDTLEGGTTAVTADLAIGAVLPAGIPITFALTGPGALSATTVQTDAAGRAQVSYLAPVATTTATVTATAVVEGQTYTRVVTINVGAVAGRMDAVFYGALPSGDFPSGVSFGLITTGEFDQHVLAVASAPAAFSFSGAGAAVSGTWSTPLPTGLAFDAAISATAPALGTRAASAGLWVRLTFSRRGTLTADLPAGFFPPPQPGLEFYLPSNTREVSADVQAWDVSDPNNWIQRGRMSYNHFQCRLGGTLRERSDGVNYELSEGGPVVMEVEAGQTLYVLVSLGVQATRGTAPDGTGTVLIQGAGAGRAATLTYTQDTRAPVTNGVLAECWDPPPPPDPGPGCGSDCQN